jgi:hypothetical protein
MDCQKMPRNKLEERRREIYKEFERIERECWRDGSSDELHSQYLTVVNELWSLFREMANCRRRSGGIT